MPLISVLGDRQVNLSGFETILVYKFLMYQGYKVRHLKLNIPDRGVKKILILGGRGVGIGEGCHVAQVSRPLELVM